MLISAFLWPQSIPAKAVKVASTEPWTAYVSPHSLGELREVVARKWPESLIDLDEFIESVLHNIVVTIKTVDQIGELPALRDIKDIPILADASGEDVDIIISGDKDLSAAGLIRPIVLTPAEFLKTNNQGN